MVIFGNSYIQYPQVILIKFDSTEFIAVPNDWDNNYRAAVIQAVRENGDSDVK